MRTALLLLAATLTLAPAVGFFHNGAPAPATSTLSSARTAGAGRPLRLRMMAASPSRPTNGERHRVVILGGGTAGVGTAAQLQNAGVEDICIVEPSPVHYYQPGWTFVGAGLFDMEATTRPTASVIPDGVRWLQAPAAGVEPEANTVTLGTGEKVGYDYLVVATGLQSDWAKIPGLVEALEMGPAGGVCSNYHPTYAPNTWATVQRLASGAERGNAIFTQPAGAIKCGGAPQKAMWMAEDYWRREGARDKFDVHFALPLPGPKLFGVDKYNPVLNAEADARGVQRHQQTVLTAVDGKKKEATFKKIGGPEEGKEFTMPFAMLHVTPPMSAPDFLKAGPLVNENGFVDVDKATLQHKKYTNVFALGDSADASALPTSKTMAAVTAMAPVVTHNLLRIMQGKRPSAQYDGYSSCPIVLGYDKLLLTEFVYGPAPSETFTGKAFFPDQGKPSFFYFLVKQFLFPFVYFNYFPKGKWFGRNLLTPYDFSRDDAAVDGKQAPAV